MPLDPPLTTNVRATCELKGPARPPVPFRVSRIRVGGSGWYVDVTLTDADEMPAMVPTRIWFRQSVGEAKCGTAPTEMEPSVAPVAGFNATSRPVEVFTLQTAPPPRTGGPPA